MARLMDYLRSKFAPRRYSAGPPPVTPPEVRVAVSARIQDQKQHIAELAQLMTIDVEVDVQRRAQRR